MAGLAATGRPLQLHSAIAPPPDTVSSSARVLPCVQVVRTRRDGSYDVELQSGEVHKSALPINVREAVGPCAPTSPDAITPPASPEETASLAVSPPAKTHAFSIGDTVEANCRGLGQYYMGVVTAILDDGSFRISYIDGDCENGVPERYIRRVQTRRRPSKAAQPGSSASARSPLKAIHNKVRGTPTYFATTNRVLERLTCWIPSICVCRERAAPISSQTEPQRSTEHITERPRQHQRGMLVR